MRLTKPILGWSLYDLANTAFSALFITFFYPVLVKVHLGGNEFQIGMVMGIALLVAAVLVPFLGAWSDAAGRRKPFVFIFTVVCVGLTILVALSNLFWALVLGFLAVLSYHAALDVYDALLITVSTKRTIGIVSGWGVAFGYLGTILSLGMAYIVITLLGADTKIGTQAILVATAFFYFLFALFLFAWTPEKKPKKRITFKKAAHQGVGSLLHTFRNIKKQKNVWMFLIASLLYTDGMNTAIVFLFLFGREQLGITVAQFFPMFAVMAVGSGAGALLFGKIADKWTPRKTLLSLVGIWVVVILLLLFTTTIQTFLIAGVIGGAALGGIWSVTRPMLVQLAPKKKTAEFFGFQGLTEKFSGVFGPPLFGFLVVTFNYDVALMSVLGFFVLGFAMLLAVKD